MTKFYYLNLFYRKLLYEFQLNNLEDTTTPHRRLSEIEVPFNTVIGLWMFEREMRLEVNAPPTMCLGSKVNLITPDRRQSKTLKGGQKTAGIRVFDCKLLTDNSFNPKHCF